MFVRILFIIILIIVVSAVIFFAWVWYMSYQEEYTRGGAFLIRDLTSHSFLRFG